MCGYDYDPRKKIYTNVEQIQSWDIPLVELCFLDVRFRGLHPKKKIPIDFPNNGSSVEKKTLQSP